MGQLAHETLQTPTGPVEVFVAQQRYVATPDALHEWRVQLDAIDPSARIVVDLAAVEHVASAFISSLLRLADAVRSAGGRLCLCRITPALDSSMRALHLDQILPIRDTLEAALDAVAE